MHINCRPLVLHNPNKQKSTMNMLHSHKTDTENSLRLYFQPIQLRTMCSTTWALCAQGRLADNDKIPIVFI